MFVVRLSVQSVFGPVHESIVYDGVSAKSDATNHTRLTFELSHAKGAVALSKSFLNRAHSLVSFRFCFPFQFPGLRFWGKGGVSSDGRSPHGCGIR